MKCDKCDEEMKDLKGCTSDTKSPFLIGSDGQYEIFRCPKRHINGYLLTLIKIFLKCYNPESGIIRYPTNSDLISQPMLIDQIFELLIPEFLFLLKKERAKNDVRANKSEDNSRNV